MRTPARLHLTGLKLFYQASGSGHEWHTLAESEHPELLTTFYSAITFGWRHKDHHYEASKVMRQAAVAITEHGGKVVHAQKFAAILGGRSL